MNTRLNLSGMALLVAALVLMVTESSVLAQGPGGQRGPGGQGQAQGGQRGPGGQQGKGGGRRGQSSPLMRMFDTDGDGTISTAEMNNATAVLMKMDKDGNGSLSAEEVRPQGGPGGGRRGGGRGQGGGQGGGKGQGGKGPRGQRPGGPEGEPQSRRGGASGDTQFANQLMELDMNGDGSLVRAELPEHMRVAFDIADVDGNGSVNAVERVALASKFRRNQLNPNGDVLQNAPTHGNR